MRFGTRLGVFLGVAPSGIVMRFLTAALDADWRAMETMGQALAGKDRALVATFATMSLKPGPELRTIRWIRRRLAALAGVGGGSAVARCAWGLDFGDPASAIGSWYG